MHDIDKNMK